VGRSRNHCCHGNTKLYFPCIVELLASLLAISETLKALQLKRYKQISVVALHLPLPNYERNFGIYIKCPTFFSMLTNFGISRQIFLKFDNVNFYENP
jgi:hypothetical protein